MFNFFKIFGKKTNESSIQTFTYFIPAPPHRKTGYREKEFDKIFYQFINSGYEVLEFKTQAISSDTLAGMWVICLVRSTGPQTKILDFSSADGPLIYDIDHENNQDLPEMMHPPE